MRAPATSQGAATRARIVAAAAALIARRGVAGTSLDDVRAATSTSKSQLYHYFGDKAGLVLAVVEHQRDAVLAQQRLADEPIDSLQALHRWRLRTLATHRRDGLHEPCPLSRLAAEVGDDDRVRPAVQAALTAWHDRLAAGLRHMVERGDLDPDADPDALGWALLGAVHGGRLLAAATGDIRPLRRCLDAAIAHVVELTGDRAGEVRRVPSSTGAQAGTT